MRAITYLISGNVFAQAISFATIPVVANLYGPETVGIAGTFAAFAAVCVQISAFSYPLAIVLPKESAEAGIITALSVIVALATSTLVALVLIANLNLIARGLNLQDVKDYLWLIPILMIVGTFYSIFDQWANRLTQYGAKAICTSVAAVLVSATKLLAGLVTPTPVALISTTSSTPFIQTILMLCLRRIRSGICITTFPSYRAIRHVASKYRDFAFFRAPEQFLNAITQGLPVLFFGALYGPVLTGNLALALAALNTPANMVGKAIVDVVYPQLSRRAQNGISLGPSLIKATAATFFLTLTPAMIFVFFAESIFSIVFGPEWIAAGQYAQCLSIWTLLMICNRPVMAAIPVLAVQKGLLLFTIVTTPLRGAAMYLAHVVYNEPIVTVIAFSIASAMINLLLILYVVTRHRGSTLSSDHSRDDRL